MSGWDVGGEDLERPSYDVPNGWHLATIEEANPDVSEKGTRLAIQYGDLTTPEGAAEVVQEGKPTFRYGNRKLFQRSWWEHTNEQATAIGRRELAELMIALGLMQKPAKGERVQNPFATPEELAAALVGQRLLVRTRQKKRMRKNADGTKSEVLDDETGMVRIDVEVVQFKAAP